MSDPGAFASVLPASLDGLLVAAVGVAIFVAPGAFVCGAAGLDLAASEKPAAWFATSLTLLTATFALCLAGGASLGAGFPSLVLLTAGAALVSRRSVGLGRGADRSSQATANDRRGNAALHRRDEPPNDRCGDPATDRRDDPPVGQRRDPAMHRPSRSALRAPRFSSLLLLLLSVAAVALATSLAPVGSVDRWWYLAYVRGWIEAPALSLDEPFLGTGRSFARFGVHPWLFGLAMWARLTAADPLRIWESAAPALVVIASLSAAAAFARALFADAARVRLAVIATILLWSGATLPLLARAGEDKVMAAAALFPLCCAGFLRFLARPAGSVEGRRELVLLVGAGIATSAVHALDYAFVLLALLPTALVVAWSRMDLRSRLGMACVALLLVGVPPAASGLLVHQRLGEIGAEFGASDHPVVRVHAGRERLVELPLAGMVVHPRLLLHPLVVFALGGWLVAIVGRRRTRSDVRPPDGTTGAAALDPRPPDRVAKPGARNGDGEHRPEADGASHGPSDPGVVFITTTTLLALALAFVPPLPSIVGAVIPPWMVYRVLWILPLAPLAAMSAVRVSRRFGGGQNTATLLLTVLGASSMLVTATGRDDGPRERVSVPPDAAFHALMNAVAALPTNALVAAAPELAERLPALTGRKVVAGLDRSTVVFAGSRQRGEARLRARAALLIGDADAGGLAAVAGVSATHAVFDPRSSERPSCDRVLHESASAALCELRRSPAATVEIPTMEDANASTVAHVVTAMCRPDVAEMRPSSGAGASRRNPWSATAPLVRCLVPVPEDVRGRDDLVLSVEVTTGRAADELRISLHDAASPLPFAARRVRVEDGVAVAFRLPPTSSPAVEVRLASSFLAFVRPRRVSIAIAPPS